MTLYNICVCMGRFQPFHWGHFDLIQAALTQGKQVIVLLGSHLRSPSLKNPWSSEEREQMIRMCLESSWQARIQFVPICDRETDEEWVTDIRQKVGALTSLNSRTSIVGHHESGKLFFSRRLPDWDYIEKLRRPGINATDIRNSYFSQSPEDDYAVKIPLGTLQYLRNFKQQPSYQYLCQEFNLRLF
ncbi:MAG TPA: adenylyltransferase/cytidyltransferase family protein [Coleofasciculaceae cyanobacterium]